ncbi:MAG: hypothetical protein JHC95_06120 [Solirubrobacteraceae bacterium]|nr:hypothetical protein [Solirubrobacteraceae bacterium]
MPKLIRVLLVVFAATALLATGCGSDTEEKNTYVDQVNDAQKKLDSEVAAANAAATKTTSDSADLKTIDAYQEAVQGVIKDLEAITPPEQVEAEHQQLIDVLTDYSDKIGKARKDLDSASAQERVDVLNDMRAASNEAGTQINQAIDAINKKLQE